MPLIEQRQAMAGEDSRELLHRLNNQLGVILAHAELLETKAQDAAQKARASQVVSAALQAMAVSRELRQTVADPK
jgi:two-component sensor histidine kinase